MNNMAQSSMVRTFRYRADTRVLAPREGGMRPPRTMPLLHLMRQRQRWVPWALTAVALATGFRVGRQRSVQVTSTTKGSVPPLRPSNGTQAYRQMKDVLDGRRFHTVFQPVFGLQDGQLLAVEALTRFGAVTINGSPTVVPPDVWFRRAGEVGLGVDLELAAIDAAIHASRSLQPDVALSVNVSPGTLADPRLEVMLREHDGRQLVLEVTEHDVVRDYPALTRAVARLRGLGCRLAVDDAGAGFASLRHVVSLAPEFVKLDASLTQELEHDPMRRALAASLVLFARRTGCQLIAEGIERPSDLAMWQHLGADGAQGYLLARPGPLQTWEDGPVLVREGRSKVR
jgi:EAL domain-containing protein (putative c-di-GMP-specific phosphodiesterase class I)